MIGFLSAEIRQSVIGNRWSDRQQVIENRAATGAGF